jgi:tRNA nucleotidyltransferase (CCA-adding enzyme)
MITDPATRVARVLPPAVRRVCALLADAGFAAVTVGGAVRDAILGRDPGDWDVATSAHPDEVVKLFARTIPTGVSHGTVTVLVGHGDERTAVEVTTFRGEGAYTDARRPDAVTFGVPLIEDLARRDLVINAIAYDPQRHELVDPFGGMDDLTRRLLRAVGDPVARFTEDGLRVMRVIRFAAQLEFSLDPATEAAIAPALPSLARVSRERVHDELQKIIATRRPSVGLQVGLRTGVLAQVLPALHGVVSASEAASQRWLARVDNAEHEIRLAAFFADLARTGDARSLERALRDLKFSNQDRQAVLARSRVMWFPQDHADGLEATAVRRALARAARPLAAGTAALWEAHARAVEAVDGAAAGNRFAVAATLAREVLARGDALSIAELAVRGDDLARHLGIAPGKRIGDVLEQLLQRVLDDPAVNSKATLIQLAAELPP